MLKKEKINHKKNENDVAKNANQEDVYIGNSLSGRKGYFCRGCNCEMEAVIQSKKHIRSYFRHIVEKGTKKTIKCSYNNITFLHEKAVEILNKEKQLKVPPLFKNPPDNSTGLAYEIRPARIIRASYSKAGLSFWENKNGEIEWVKGDKSDSVRDLHIIPDVTFFNEKDEPILFIEIRVTHKCSLSKITKLKGIGVDTVEITIPRNSLDKIETYILTNTNNSKWLYNYEEEKTIYVYQSGNREIPSLDTTNRTKLFQCFKADVRNFTAKLRKRIQSEPYSISEKAERDRATKNKQTSQRLEQKLEDSFQGDEGRSYQKYKKTERDTIAKHTGLERRYFVRKEEIEKSRGAAKKRRGEIKVLQGIIRNEEEEINRELELALEKREVVKNKFKIIQGEIHSEFARETGEQHDAEKKFNIERARFRQKENEFIRFENGIREDIESKFREENYRRIEIGVEDRIFKHYEPKYLADKSTKEGLIDEQERVNQLIIEAKEKLKKEGYKIEEEYDEEEWWKKPPPIF